MLAGMDEDTYQLWQRFYAEEPFGPGVQNMMAAQSAAAAAGSSDVDAFLPMTATVDDG